MKPYKVICSAKQIRVILHTLFIFSGVQASMARNVFEKKRQLMFKSLFVFSVFFDVNH